ncbi:RNA polymerase sigma factor [Jatrophihabitans sp.]|uniref:RNA polymerase sigma factor n=1 Tax=Jatrophihabitans sp. TaxID=1932789 RepID=UPI0030C70283|nr:polymerase, sigma-24 subunit, subfamily [Jatrophihabitans sp.]
MTDPAPVAAAESDLVAAIDGDTAAFANLYRDLQPRLRRYAWSLVGQDADDVTGEAWLQIARDLRAFSGDLDSFRGWTARIVRNRALDHLRATARRPAAATDVAHRLDQPTPDAEMTALEALSTAAALELIRRLPREQAEAVLLRAVVGLDSATAGEVLGKSATAVRVAAHRGLKALAKQLVTDGTHPRVAP